MTYHKKLDRAYIQYTEEKLIVVSGGMSAIHILPNSKTEIIVKPNWMVVRSLLLVNFQICSSFHQFLEDNDIEVNLS